jgi:hypothetical protein
LPPLGKRGKLVFAENPDQGSAGVFRLKRGHSNEASAFFALSGGHDLSVIKHHPGVLQRLEYQSCHGKPMVCRGTGDLMHGLASHQPAYFFKPELVGGGLRHSDMGAVHGVKPSAK